MKSLKKNYLYNIIYQMLLLMIPLITTPYVSRILGAEGVGSYSYTCTIAKYFVLAAMLGVQNYGNRSIAAVRENRASLERVFSEIFCLQCICASLASLLYFFFVFHMLSETYRLTGLIQGLYVLSALPDISWFYFGLEEFRLTVTRNIFIKLISLVGIFLFVRTSEDLWIYTLLIASGTLCSNICLWFFIKGYVRLRLPQFRDILKHLKPELLLFVPVIAVSMYKMMDKVMLEALSGVIQVGYYDSAEKIINIPMGLITALGTVMLPRMSHLAAAGDEKKSRTYLSASLLFTSFLASGLCFGIVGTASELVPLFFGREYLDCIPLLIGLAPSVCFISWANVLRTQYLIPRHQDRSYTRSVLLGALINMVLNVLLIPGYQGKGAVIATLCAEAAVCICQTVSTSGQISVLRELLRCLPFYVNGVLMFLFIRLLAQLQLPAEWKLILEITAGGAVYVLLSALFIILLKFRLKLKLFEVKN
ncbi:MAG: flippase [Lachnospiraceae bacterium]|nr:flippase [Lachnospiraceae bacterium]